MASDAAPAKYLGLRDLTDADKLANKRQESERLRSVLKRDWALNREYYNGNQWSFWNNQMLRVEALPADTGPAWKIRLQSNQVKPGLASYVAQLIKTRPTIFAEPNSSSDTDVKAAEMASALYETVWDDLALNQKAADALTEAGLSGGYWHISWDALAGKPMTWVIGPDGMPILDDELAEVFLDELEAEAQQAGMDPQQLTQMAKKTVYVGDIRVQVMMAENVLLDPSAASFADAKWAICRHALDPDEIAARWGKKVEPNAYKGADSPLAFAHIEEKKPDATLREVYIMYVRPNPSLPKGRYVAWIEDPNTILQDMEWPYPFQQLPLVKFPGKYRPDSPYDDPIVTEARPLQKDLNKTLSQMVEHKNLVLRPQMLAPIGSLRSKLTSEPGAVFEYNPVGPNLVPQWREMPPIPQSLFAHLENLQARLDRVFNRIPSSRDQIPARADGGGLLEAMQEATADQISTVILALEDSLAQAGQMIALLAQKNMDEPRLLRIKGINGGTQVKKFEAADIAGGFVFKAKYGTGLPRTRQGKQDAILALVEAKIIDPAQAVKELDLGDIKGVAAKMAADEDQAFREHDKILRGIPINQPALQSAQADIQSFQMQAAQILQQLQEGVPVDIDGDGVPDPPQVIVQQLQQTAQQLQQALDDAPWQPLDWENWQSHIESHGTFMKSSEFERYDPQIQAIFIHHYNLTYQRWLEIMANMPDPNNTPKVNVRAMGTVSAPVMAKILAKSGVQVTEDEVAEPALDTAVVEDLNQPQVDPSGNDPISQLDTVLATQAAQDKHVVAQADAAQSLAHAADSHAQQQRHAEEKHQADMANAAQTAQQGAEMHKAKVQQAKKPPVKPKGGR